MLLSREIAIASESSVERKAQLYSVGTLIRESKLRLPEEASAEIEDDIRLGAQRKMKLFRPRQDRLRNRQDRLLTLGWLWPPKRRVKT